MPAMNRTIRLDREPEEKRRLSRFKPGGNASRTGRTRPC